MTGDRNLFENLGMLQGTGAAIMMTGGRNTIFNGGVIDTLGIGLQLAGDANLLDNVGTLRAGGSGIRIDGSNNVVTNAGLIDVTGAGTALQASGDGNHVVNSGTVRAGDVGLQLTGRWNLFSNIGTVTGSGRGAAVTLAGAGNAVVNSGLVEALGGGVGVELTGSGGSVHNAGEIRSTGIALFLGGGSNALTNDGRIGGGAVGVSTRGASTTVANHGVILSDGIGVLLSGTGEKLTNDGLVRAAGAAIRVDSAAGVSTTIVNAADAAIQSTGAAAIVGGDGNERVENHGLLAGNGVSVDLGGGDDLLHLSTTALIGGTARGGSGLDSLELGGTGAVRTDLGSYVDFETLSKVDTGTWVLTGTGNMAWTVEAGLLVVEDTLGGPGLVRAGSRLAGAGIVGGFLNQGTVAPGNSIGTLRIAGDYEHAAGAALEIEGAITGESDLLEISGRALLRGGTIAVTPESRPFGIATEMTIVDAAGGINGTFGRATSTLAHLDPYLDYEPQKVFLTLIRNDISFAAMGEPSGGNLRSLGTALDANKKAMARGDFKLLMDQFLFIDADRQRSALRALSGELHASTARTLLHTGNRFFSASVDRQLSAERLEEDRKTFWADAFGFAGSLDSDGNASATNYSATGIATGIDFLLTDETRVGAAFGYSPGTTELDRFASDSVSVRSYHPAVYAEHETVAWSVGGGFGYSRHDVRASRAVEVGPIVRTAATEYEANQYIGQFAGAFSIVQRPIVSLKGFGELRYSRLLRPSFGESGAESADLTGVADARTESLRSVLGVRASWRPNIWGIALLPDVRLGWMRESLDRQGQLTASLTGAAARADVQRFSVLGVTEARDGLLFSVGATTAPLKRGRVFVAYDRLFTGQGFEHGFAAGLKLGW
jgi:uncharacterized protein with beta-barrel porin domain